VEALRERRLDERRFPRRHECEVRERLRVELLPVSLPVDELVADDVRLEDARVTKERDVA
jgi:hypothetical protein